MIVIPTSASYTMEGRILSMPFTTLTESGLEMMFCLTSGHSSFSRDKKSGCSQLMITIVILKRPHTNHIGSFEILVLTSSLTSPDDVAYNKECCNYCMSETFDDWIIHNPQTADFWFCQFSGIMGHGTVTSLDSCLIFFAWLSPSACFRKRCYCLIVRYLFVKAAEGCMMAMVVWLYISSHTRSGSDSSSCLLSFISLAIDRYFRTPEGWWETESHFSHIFGEMRLFHPFYRFSGSLSPKIIGPASPT